MGYQMATPESEAPLSKEKIRNSKGDRRLDQSTGHIPIGWTDFHYWFYRLPSRLATQTSPCHILRGTEALTFWHISQDSSFLPLPLEAAGIPVPNGGGQIIHRPLPESPGTERTNKTDSPRPAHSEEEDHASCP